MKCIHAAQNLSYRVALAVYTIYRRRDNSVVATLTGSGQLRDIHNAIIDLTPYNCENVVLTHVCLECGNIRTWGDLHNRRTSEPVYTQEDMNSLINQFFGPDV